MTLNALAHGVPAEAVHTVPATTTGPTAALTPTRSDLLGWAGIHRAVRELTALATAAGEGRRWLDATGPTTTADALLALGVLDLTHPATAAELTRHGPATLRLADLRRLATRLPAPTHLAEVCDAALKAHCDRAGYLLGTPDEHTHRELVERHLPTAAGHTRARLAAGDTTALAQALHTLAPTDSQLDHHTWRHHPPHPDATQTHTLLAAASRAALHRFAGTDIHPHPSRAAALAARYPDRALRRGLALTPTDLTHPQPATPAL